MLLIDDLLAAPLNGLLWVFKEIQKQATEEQRNRRDAIMAALSALYVALEQGQLSEAEFDAREQTLLDELDDLDAADDAEEAEGDAAEPKPEYALKTIPAEAGADDPPAAARRERPS
jgi:hypothetical protein